jgi:PAS domain S-box-containing protein
MPTISRVIRTSDQIRTDIEQIYGFLPPFFEPARSTPLVMESLWQLTLLADIDSSLPVQFKQRLNASLARFCAVPYYMVCHASALNPLDMTGREVLALLEAPLPLPSEVEEHLAALNSSPILLSTFPDSESPQELALIACAAVIFLRGSAEEACRECVERVLGAKLFNSFSLYLAYIKTCHAWLDMHPDISYETDEQLQDCLGPLLAESPTLGDFFRNCREKVKVLRFSRGERKVAVEVRQASERSHEILESITDAFFALDKEWRFTYINAGAEQIVRRTREELLGKIVWEEFPEAKDSVAYAQYQFAAAERIPVTFEFFYPPLDIWLAVRVYPSAEGISVFFQNVSERKAADEAQWRLKAQRESEERNRLMVDALPHIAWTTGSDGATDYYNQRWYEYSGLTVEETSAGGWKDVMHPEDLAQAAGLWNAAIEAGEAWGTEYRLRRSDGTFRLHLGRSEPVRVEGKIIRWVGTATDIEDRRVAEEALKISLLQTARILESISDAFYALDTEWHFTYVNAQAALLLRRTREELIGKSLWTEFPEAVGTKPDLLFRRAVETGVIQSFEDYYPPLSSWFGVRAYPSPDGLSVYFHDISERKTLTTA